MDSLPHSIFFKDGESRFIRVNNVSANLLGLENPREAIGRSDADFYSAAYAIDTIEGEAQIMKNGVASVDRVVSSVTNGEVISYSVTKAPIGGRDGIWTGIVGIGRNVTEYVRASEALQVSEERFRTAFDRASVGMAIVGVDGEFLQANSAFCDFIEYTEKEVLASTVDDFTHPDDRAESRKFMQSVSREPTQPGQTEKRYVTRSGSVAWGAVNVAALTDRDGRTTSFIAQIQDITFRKQMEDRLIEAKESAETASKAKSEFISQMSHEFRTPLNTINLLAHMLVDEVYGAMEPRQDRSVKQIGEAAGQLSEMIDDILELSEVTYGQREMVRSDLDVSEVTAAAREIIQPLASERGVHIELNVESGIDRFAADRRSIIQILVNLLSNGVNSTAAGGRVGVDAAQSNDEIRFAVWDTGHGIPQEDMPGLFEPFTRIRGGPDGSRSGTGIGLAVVHRLVTMHGGNVSAESELRRGTRITVWLPIRSDRIRGTVGMGKSRGAAPAEILVVEDHEVNAAGLRDFLEAQGFRVGVATDGASALLVAEQDAPDIMLLDVGLPDMSGLDVLREIRSRSELRSLPVVATTAHSMPGDRERCIEAGATAYVAKPIDLEALATVIKAVLAR